MKSILPKGRACALAAVAFGIAAAAQAQSLSSAGTIAVPTYESAGLYWTSPGGTAGCELKFRKSGESAWRAGLPMWYDARDSQCRGSLVALDPNTDYDVELNLPGQAAARALTFKTWSNSLPVARTIAVNSGSGTLNVAEGGSATGYVVYEGNGATLDAGNVAQYNVTINASYVIVRGLNLKGAKQDAIRISPTVKDVVIEDNDISGWGRTRDGRWGADMDSGIRAVCSQPTMERVTIQRNRIHDPRYGANSWSDGHPAGPQGVTISYCGGNHVIRHNEMYSSNGNYFNDVIGGEDNFTKSGFPNADTDIYGNRIANAWDDGIEAEGANENVRIWGNYIDRTAIGIATTVTSVGPVYIFRNVWNRAQMYQNTALDSDDRQPFFKSGSDSSLGNGRRYVFHNTMLQARQAGLVNGLGGGFGMGGTGAAQLINNTFSKNNIYHLWKDGRGAFYQMGSGNDFASDLYNGTTGEGTETGGISGTPVYADGNGWQSEAGGLYQLAASSPGFGRGVPIANFNDADAAPDVGAHPSGSAAMKFGVAASSGSAVSGSPPPPPPTGGSIVALSTTSLNFYGSAPLTQTVTYTNNTGVLVTFIQASMTSARFGQTNNCGDVQPGASCTSTVTYYPTNTGPDTGTFTVTSTAPNSPHGVSLSALAPPPPVPTTYGLTVISTGTATGTVTSSPSGIDCGSTCSATFNAGTAIALTATPASGATFAGWAGACSGTGSCSVTLDAAKSVTATFTAAVVPPPPTGGSIVALSTTSLNFYGSAPRTQTVTYTNNTGVLVTFIQASMTSARFGQTNNCGDVQPGASCTSTVTYYPTNTGPDTGTFTVTSTAPNSPHGVSLSALAPTTPPPTGGTVTQSATSLSFNLTTRTRTVTYTNNTGARVTFIKATMSSGKFGQTNNCGEVAPGASCTATVTYYPSNNGSNTATFTLTSTAPNSPHVVSLTGKNKQ